MASMARITVSSGTDMVPGAARVRIVLSPMAGGPVPTTSPTGLVDLIPSMP